MCVCESNKIKRSEKREENEILRFHRILLALDSRVFAIYPACWRTHSNIRCPRIAEFSVGVLYATLRESIVSGLWAITRDFHSWSLFLGYFCWQRTCTLRGQQGEEHRNCVWWTDGCTFVFFCHRLLATNCSGDKNVWSNHALRKMCVYDWWITQFFSTYHDVFDNDAKQINRSRNNIYLRASPLHCYYIKLIKFT